MRLEADAGSWRTFWLARHSGPLRRWPATAPTPISADRGTWRTNVADMSVAFWRLGFDVTTEARTASSSRAVPVRTTAREQPPLHAGRPDHRLSCAP